MLGELEQTKYGSDSEHVVDFVRVYGQLQHKMYVEEKAGQKVDDVDHAARERRLARTDQEAYGQLDGEPDITHYVYVQKGRIRCCRLGHDRPGVIAALVGAVRCLTAIDSNRYIVYHGYLETWNRAHA